LNRGDENNSTRHTGERGMKLLLLVAFVLELSALSCHSQSGHLRDATGAASQSLPFRPAIHLPVGELPGTVKISDVNHDGKNDILVANGGSSNLSVYLGDDNGAFSQANGSPFATGPNPSDIDVGDFNGDGNPDLAIANHSVKLVTVLVGNGKGQFAFGPGSPFEVPSNPHPHGIAVAEFNGDQKLDLAVDSWGENKVLVLSGNGDGAFQTPGVKYDVGKAPYERLRTADVNEDGNPDIITSNWEGRSVSVLFGDSKGQFSRRDFAVPESPFGIAIGDFDGDHHRDIAIGHYSGHAADPSKNGLSVLLGNGKGNFTLAKGSPFPVGRYPPTLAAGDLNGDGIDDVALPCVQDDKITVYLGGRNGIASAGYSPIAVGKAPESVAIGDVNGDGRADLVVVDQDDKEVLLFLSN
jgi:hypothetical protein